MTKTRKKLVGLLGLSFVAIMTTVAYFMPEGARATGPDTVTETIRVTVYDREKHPVVKITSPESESSTVSPDITVNFDYENTQYIDFELAYVDEDGNPQTVSLPRFNPENLDPTFNYDTGSNTLTINLDTLGLSYANYVLTAKAYSPIGYAEDTIEFNYVPAKVEQGASDETTNDPVIVIDYDEGVAKIEVTVTDKNGNPILGDPMVFEIDEPYEGGHIIKTLPFSSYGLESGEYNVIVKTYKYVQNAEGEWEYVLIESPVTIFVIGYTQPNAPAIPDTGGLFKNLNATKSDLIMTSIIAFAAVLIISSVILTRRKKDYRKNYRIKK